MRYQDRIDPELRRAAKRVPYHKWMIGWANLFQSISFRLTRIPKGVVHRGIRIKGYRGKSFRTEVFEPAKGTGELPCLVYAHGGAFSYKAASYHKKLACLYALRAHCRVFFPDYHLLPRYPYPAAYEDVLALYRYIEAHGKELGVNIEKIGLAGDSAGGALAALLCNRYEQEGLKRPCLQMLVYPLTDADMGTESMRKFTDTPLWNAKNNRRMWGYYGRTLGDEIQRASPIHSELPRLLPETYIETAEFDCLRDEGILFGKKLQEAGAQVEINETKGTFHGYDLAISSKVAVYNIEKRIQFLQKNFYGGKPD